MPPKPKTPEQIEQARTRILDSALNITAKQGYDALSMRKIATQSGMSATNIYNYFHNKDEVYLSMLGKGFQLLYEETSKAIRLGQNAKERFEQAIKTYVDFGLEKTHYYEIMFSSHTPKYLDYLGLPSEESAYKTKIISFKWFDCFTECVSEVLPDDQKNKDIRIVVFRIMAQIQGTINIYHNKLIKQAYDNPIDIVNETVEHVMEEMGIYK